jgi:hypothetical protein
VSFVAFQETQGKCSGLSDRIPKPTIGGGDPVILLLSRTNRIKPARHQRHSKSFLLLFLEKEGLA